MEYRYRDASEMKDSGVEWIGKIPKDWEINKLKNISSIYGRIGFRGYTVNDLVSEGEGAITLSPSNIEEQKLKLDKLTYISWEKYEESPEIKVYNEDIVFVKTASVGKVAYIEGLLEKATINPQFVVFKNIKMNKKLLYYILVSNVIQEQINSGINGGVVSTLTQQDINNYYIPYQNNIEQEKIANFLDKKTLQFDSIISKKEALIEKLEEAKKSLISEVVTGKVKVVKTDDGYDLVKRSNDEMKDSGVEWIAEIPKDWEVKRIKQISNVISKGTTPSTIGREIADNGKIRFLKAENIYDGDICLTPQFFIDEETNKILKRSELKEHDILFVIAGATIGKTAIVKKAHCPANTNQAISFIRLYNNINYKFVYFWLSSPKLQENMWLYAVQSAQPNLSMENLGNFHIVYPNKEEIDIITDYIEINTIKICEIMESIRYQIQKLKEAKQSLISEAVTGKIEILD